MTELLGWALISVFLIVAALPVLGALALIWSALRIQPRPPGIRRFIATLCFLLAVYFGGILVTREISGVAENLVSVAASVAFLMLVGIYLFVPPENPLRGLEFIDTFLIALVLGFGASAVVLGAGAPGWWVLVVFPAAQLAIVFYHLVLRAYLRGMAAGR